MPIQFNQTSQIFHLYNDQISYILGILPNGHLGHYHFGSRLEEPLSSDLFRADQNKGLTAYVNPNDFGFSLNLERQEYPVFGTSDFREPALTLTLQTGSQIVDFKYSHHLITAGKPPISGLPSTFSTTENPCSTLVITLKDRVTDLELDLYFSLFETLPIMSRRAELVNRSGAPITIDKIMSMSIDLMDDDWQWLQFSGDWIKERHLYKTSLRPGIQSIESRRGASGAEHNPFLILKRPDTNEVQGEALGVSLVYSSNFSISGQVDANGVTRVMAGINPALFKWVLKPLETFETPEALMVYSVKGLEHLSHSFHRLFKENLMVKKWQALPRPLLINSWEAMYFDFDEDKLLHFAKEAASLGMELFVLDDGWFSSRNDDSSGLGDWSVNAKKLPSGITGLAQKINALGLQFGLWIEPEMINLGTQLYEQHPDWVIYDPTRMPCHARNQYILDFSRPEVVEHIFKQLTALFDDAPIAYLKWDMNRNMTDHYSHGLKPENQGELSHRYIKGVYSLYDRLIDRYPNILIESCAAGGGRFDPGILYYSPQIWASDNTDPTCRLKIQYGTSFAYPISAMGAHVSASPNHQLKRTTPLKTRADVAYFGSLGYELNLIHLSDAEKAEIKEQINFYKTHRSLLHSGDFYRLISPFESNGNHTAWMIVNHDKSTAIVGWYQSLAYPNESLKTIKLRGLDPKATYSVEPNCTTASGSTLMSFGLLLRPSFNGIHMTADPIGDHQSRVMVLKKV